MMITSSTPGDERAAAPVIVVGGGQSGLAAARALHELRMPTVILEASDRPTGSWPRYYDSLRVFSPAGYSSMPGMPFPGAPDRYPGRDEVADYLERYAARLDVEIQTNTRVETIHQDGQQFIVVTEGDGHCAHPASWPQADRSPTPTVRTSRARRPSPASSRTSPTTATRLPYAGQRVIVVGAGDSAAQVANELAPVAAVTLATRHPVRFIPQRLGGQDVHYWLRETGFDTLPAAWLSKITCGSVVTDSVGFQQTLAEGRVDQRPMFIALDGNAGGLERWPARAGRRDHPRDRVPAQSGLPARTRGARLHMQPRSTSAASHPHTSAWSTSAWSSSARMPPIPSGASARTPER